MATVAIRDELKQMLIDFCYAYRIKQIDVATEAIIKFMKDHNKIEEETT